MEDFKKPDPKESYMTIRINKELKKQAKKKNLNISKICDVAIRRVLEGKGLEC